LSAGQGKFAGERSAFHHCAMQPTTNKIRTAFSVVEMSAADGCGSCSGVWHEVAECVLQQIVRWKCRMQAMGMVRVVMKQIE